MTCKAILAFEDTNGQLHRKEEYCYAANARIEKRERYDKLLIVYQKLWPSFLDSTSSEYPYARGADIPTHRFLERILDDGYIIVREEDVKNII